MIYIYIYIHTYIHTHTLIFKGALISGCLLVRICVWQIERILPSRAEIYQTRTSWVFTDFHWFNKKKQAAQRAQFPTNDRTFEKRLLPNLAVPQAEIGKTSWFGFLEQKFVRAEIGVLLKLQVKKYTHVIDSTFTIGPMGPPRLFGKETAELPPLLGWTTAMYGVL